MIVAEAGPAPSTHATSAGQRTHELDLRQPPTAMSHPPLPPEPGRRVAARKALRVSATLAFAGAAASVQTRDLARDGLSVVAPRPIAPGTRCQVDFDLPLGHGESRPVSATARVVYSSYVAPGEFRIGAVFTELDEDTAVALGEFATAP